MRQGQFEGCRTPPISGQPEPRRDRDSHTLSVVEISNDSVSVCPLLGMLKRTWQYVRAKFYEPMGPSS